MKKLALSALLLILQTVAFAQAPVRPRITGIDHVAFYTTARDGVRRLYTEVLGLPAADPVESGQIARYMVGTQWIGYSHASDATANNRMDHIAFRTDSLVALRRYLAAKGLKPSEIQGAPDHSLFIQMKDPEGYAIEFVERSSESAPVIPAAVSKHMIHAGFLVYNRPAEDHFYIEILGFRPYWHGGMKDDVTEWVSMQVPDGSDWLEYMLNQPAHPDLHLTGVMNHCSLGVADIKQAQAALETHGWKPHGDEKAQMGRDGKWQLNLYDPDFTRVELMEFKPAQKPCCSDFTAPHPNE